MTKIVITKSRQGAYLGFTCSGHAGYADYGKDIVCAAVSALVTNTVNSLEQLAKENFEVSAEEENGYLRCTFLAPPGEKGILLMDSLALGLKSIEKEAGRKYMRLIFEEV